MRLRDIDLIENQFLSSNISYLINFVHLFHFIFQTYVAKHVDSQSLLDSLNSKYYYYTRTRGLFRICYPKERPPASAGKCESQNCDLDLCTCTYVSTEFIFELSPIPTLEPYVLFLSLKNEHKKKYHTKVKLNNNRERNQINLITVRHTQRYFF